MKMKKLLKKWLKSEAYNEYCINMARMYNYRTTDRIKKYSGPFFFLSF